MQPSVVHDPIARATPTQVERARARRVRLARMERRHPMVPANDAFAEPEIPAATVEQWADRQVAIHAAPIFKPLWFWIDDLRGEFEPRVTVDVIQRAVAKSFQVTLTDLLSDRRTANLIRPRHVAYFLSKNLTMKSLPEIGRLFRGRDHTTILNGVRRTERLIQTDPDLAATVAALTDALNPKTAAPKGDQ